MRKALAEMTDRERSEFAFELFEKAIDVPADLVESIHPPLTAEQRGRFHWVRDDTGYVVASAPCYGPVRCSGECRDVLIRRS